MEAPPPPPPPPPLYEALCPELIVMYYDVYSIIYLGDFRSGLNTGILFRGNYGTVQVCGLGVICRAPREAWSVTLGPAHVY